MEIDKMCMIPGYAYVPSQRLRQTYDADKALEAGTLFPSLNLPMEIYGKQDLSECEENIRTEGEND